MEKRRRHQHTEAHPLGDGSDPGQRGVRLQEIGPRRTDLWDLAQMVHHPDVVDACRFGVHRDGPQVFGQVLVSARPIEAGQMQPDFDRSARHRFRGCAPSPVVDRRRLANAAGTTTTGAGVSTSSHGSAMTSSRIDGQRRSCPEITSAGTAIDRALLRRRHSAAAVSNTTAMHGTPASAAKRRQVARGRGVEAQRVDDRCQPSPHSAGDDLVHQCERVSGGPQIVLTFSDDGSQRIAGHDLIRSKVLGGPPRLAGANRADQYDQAGGRDLRWLGDRARLLRGDACQAGTSSRRSTSGRSTSLLNRNPTPRTVWMKRSSGARSCNLRRRFDR